MINQLAHSKMWGFVNILFPPFLSSLNSTCCAELPAGEPKHWKTRRETEQPVKSRSNTNNHLKSAAYTLITPLWAHEQINICGPWMKKHLRDYFSTHCVNWGITLQWIRRTVSISFSLHYVTVTAFTMLIQTDSCIINSDWYKKRNETMF